MGMGFVMKNNIKRSLAHKGRWLILLLLPLLLSLASYIINQIHDSTLRVGVFMSGDTINEEYQKLFLTQREAIRTWNGQEGVLAKEALATTIHTDIIMGVYHFAIDLSHPMDDSIISYGSKENVSQLQQHLFEESNQQSQNTEEIETLSPLRQSIAFLMTMFLIFSVIHGGMYIKDKENGMILRFCYSPQKKYRYFLGNCFYLMSITFVQVVISFCIVCLVNGTWLSFAAALKVVLFITFTSSVFAMLLCYFSKTETQASITASSVAAVLALLGGTFVPVSAMPNALQILSVISPIRWCLELVERL